MTLAVVVWLRLPNRERIIKSRLHGLAAAISIQPGESQLVRAANASRVLDYFTSDVAFELEGINVPLRDHGDLREAALAARASLREAEFQFHNIELRFPESGEAATAYVTVLGMLNRQTNSFVRELKFSLRRVEGQWRIAEVKDVGGL